MRTLLAGFLVVGFASGMAWAQTVSVATADVGPLVNDLVSAYGSKAPQPDDTVRIQSVVFLDVAGAKAVFGAHFGEAVSLDASVLRRATPATLDEATECSFPVARSGRENCAIAAGGIHLTIRRVQPGERVGEILLTIVVVSTRTEEGGRTWLVTNVWDTYYARVDGTWRGVRLADRSGN